MTDPLIDLMDAVDTMRAKRDAGPAHRELGRLDAATRATGRYATQPGYRADRATETIRGVFGIVAEARDTFPAGMQR